jgi:GT2 family glycosyltransferase
MDRVVIGYVHPGVVRAEFMRSMLNTVTTNRDTVEAVISVQSGPLLATARNDLVQMFLADHRAAWLWMVDTDMVFTPDAVTRLIQAADPDKRPIMGGLCFSDGPDGPEPVLYDLSAAEGGGAAFGKYTVWPEDDVMPVGGTGAACLLVHRSVYKRIRAGWAPGKSDPVFPWFRESSIAGRRALGEDLTFCLRAQSAGIPIHVHTGVQVGHMKTHMLGKVS